MTKASGGKVIAIHGIGTDSEDEHGFVDVTMHDGDRYTIAFDIHLANELATAFLLASQHLRTKIALRQPAGSTLIPGQPIPIQSTAVTVAQAGPDRHVLLDMKTEQGTSFLLSMSPRSAETLGKRLTNRKMAAKTQSPAGRIQ